MPKPRTAPDSRKKKLPPANKKRPVPTPFSTGGGGFLFEKNVAACFLAWLLIKSPTRGIPDLEVIEVKFQRRFIDDLPMDDIVVSYESPGAPRGKAQLSLQLKADLAWGDGESNQTFHEVMRACWDTFRSPDFARGHDAFGIVVSREKSDYHAYREVITTALQAADGADFTRMVTAATSAKHREFLGLIRTKLNAFLKEDNFAQEVSEKELWLFVRSLQLLHFDVLDDGSRDYQNCLTQLKIFLGIKKTNRARDVWNELLRLAGESIPRAGSFRRDDLWRRLSMFHEIRLDEDDSYRKATSLDGDAPNTRAPIPREMGIGSPSKLDHQVAEATTQSHRVDDSSDTSRVTAEAKLEAKVDIARDLLMSGNIPDARKLLEQVRAWTAFPLSARLQYRVAANLGSCAFASGDKPLAIAEYRAAYRQEKNNPKAMVIGAHAEILDDKPNDAIPLCEAALGIEPRFSDAARAYIYALKGAEKTEELAAWLERENWVSEDLNCIPALSEVDSEAGNLDKAIERLESARLRAPKNPEISSKLAAYLLSRGYETWKSNPQFSWRLEGPVRRDLEQVVALTKGLLDSENSGVDREAVAANSSNRSVALMLLGRDDEAMEELQKAVGLEPDSPTILLNLGWLRNKRGEADLAIEPLEKAVSQLQREADDTWWEAVRGLAFAYFAAGKWANARQFIASSLDWDGHSFNRTTQSEPDTFDLIALWLVATQNLIRTEENPDMQGDLAADARTALTWLETTAPDHPQALSARADFHWMEGQYLKATRLMRHAFQKATGARRERLALVLAESLFARRRYAAAVPLYKEVVKEDAPNVYLAHYVISLVRSKTNYEEALRIARQARSAIGRPKDSQRSILSTFLEVEASSAEYVGDWQVALDLRRKLVELMPERQEYRISLALLEYQNGGIQTARNILEAVSPPDPHQYPDLLMRLAEAKAVLLIPGSLELAYAVWRVSPLDAELQARYISVFNLVSASQNPLLHPIQVGLDCAVTVQVHNEEWTRIIIAQNSLTKPLLPSEIPVNQPQARTLLGKEARDEVLLQQTQWGDVTGIITNVRHKYVYAYQETIARFGRGELKHGSFQVGRADSDGDWLKKQAESLKAQREAWLFLAEIYQNQPLPLCAVGAVRHRHVLELWSEISSVGGRFYSAGGDISQIYKDWIGLDVDKPLVLEPTSLATIALLNIEQEVRAKFPNLFVAHAVWLELNEYLQKEALAPQASGYIWHDGVQLRYTETSPEEAENRRAFLTKIITFINSSCRVVSVPALLHEKVWPKWLGKGTIASILLAKDNNATLWTDDERLRRFAASNYSVKSTYFWPILISLRAAGWSVDNFKRALCKLSLQGYCLVYLFPEVLIWRLREDDLKLTKETRTLIFRNFNGHDTNVKWAARELAHFLHTLWVERPLASKFRDILYACLESFVVERSTKPALQELREQLRFHFRFDEFSLRLLDNDLSRWEASNLRIINRGIALERGRIEVATLDSTLTIAHPSLRATPQ